MKRRTTAKTRTKRPIERQKKAPAENTGENFYHISSVASRFNIHPQTLRLYEREGLLKPSRSCGNTRLYSDEDVKRLELILNLVRDLGVNLAGRGSRIEYAGQDRADRSRGPILPGILPAGVFLRPGGGVRSPQKEPGARLAVQDRQGRDIRNEPCRTGISPNPGTSGAIWSRSAAFLGSTGTRRSGWPGKSTPATRRPSRN